MNDHRDDDLERLRDQYINAHGLDKFNLFLDVKLEAIHARDERDNLLDFLRDVMWGTEFLCISCNSPYDTHKSDCKLVTVLENK